MRMVSSMGKACLMAAVLLAGAWNISSAEAARAPLLMEGKKTLYQRVLTRPGAQLVKDPAGTAGKPQPALTRLYVYGRVQKNGADWLEVGLTAKGQTDGWIAADYTLPWKQQMTLAFTNPAGRDRSLLFKDRDTLATLVNADNPAATLAPLRKTVAAGKTDPAVVSIEPETYVDLNKQFYLLPILSAEETFAASGHRMRLLEVASVTQQEAKADKAAAPKANGLRNFSASVVFVIDSTISMGPYIDRTRDAVKRIYDRIEKAGLADKVRFGMVAFRSNIDKAPALEYVSRLYADPNQVKSGKEFLDKVSGLKQATVSSARFSEDAYSGVMTALDKVDWANFGGRYVVLITDAGALRGNDPLSGTRLDAEQVRLEAQHRGVALYAMHLRTPEGKANHAEAEAQYKALTTHPLVPHPLYYPVESGSVDAFGKIVDSLSDAIVDQVNASARGEEVAGSALSASKETGDQVKDDAALLGHAMKLAWLGRTEGTRAPPLFSAWISDRDLVKPDVATTEVRVLLTKNQLSDMQQVVKSILDAGQAAQLSPKDFFARMRSAAATLGRDPNAINAPNAQKLADLGLMGEYLDDLPYRSKVLDLDQETWSSWSISQQQVFLDELQRKLRLYQIYHDDVSRWVALDGGADPGEAVYPVPLDAMP
ncbi:vWA domain-containing protein [Novispirillum itersonii]|uniref:VWFA domain-containing protein n=1 Tax=Novispirillum itersonii TaxID=189 RepID=A0A7W9ZIQ3_NOVIT|nr:vWA domain-containing protein [Novispirillum itersonii]MBB6212242.1 hypothetical protein [Novispirillum itersonii]